MKLVEKIVYDFELTADEREIFHNVKRLFDRITIDEMDQLCTYIASVMGDEEEDRKTVEQNIDIFYEYLDTLPL